jgi:UDP-3-O-[3-hydroxymyristoyl] glucosamine N-acyltransferase
MKSFTIEQLNEVLKGVLRGNSNLIISEPEHIKDAKESSICFIGGKSYIDKWVNSESKAAIIQENLLEFVNLEKDCALIVVKNADLAMAKLLELFSEQPVELNSGIHPSATVSSSANIGNNTTIGANCYIGNHVNIGENTTIYPNTIILDNAIIGNHTTIKSGTVISEKCEVGHQCILHFNVNIGTDGFGYRPSEDGKNIVKIPHIGNVVIGHQVEIGSGTCIDKGKFGSTTIGNATKIDNLVQIGHNCVIGMGCLIAGCCGISGSVTMGNGVIVAGHVSIKDHVNIGDGVTIGGKSGVVSDIPAGKTYLGFPATDAKKTMRKWAALNRLIK